MKEVEFRKSFEKAYTKRIRPNAKLDQQFSIRFDEFRRGKRDAPLDDHALTGSLKGLRSFSVAGDIRVIYRETATSYEFIDIGTHNQVYK